VFFFWGYNQSGDDPKQDLAKYGYKKNMKVKKYKK
jgi:hypothetical protein